MTQLSTHVAAPWVHLQSTNSASLARKAGLHISFVSDQLWAEQVPAQVSWVAQLWSSQWLQSTLRWQLYFQLIKENKEPSQYKLSNTSVFPSSFCMEDASVHMSATQDDADGEASVCRYLTGRSESQRMMGTCCNLDHLLTWQSLDTQRLKSGHTRTHTQPHYVMYFNYCRHFWFGGRIKWFANKCSFAVRPGELISMAELPLRAPTPAPDLCVKRWQPIIFLLLRCRLGLTTRGFQVCASTLSPWRPWKKKKHPHKNTGDCCSTNRTMISLVILSQ